MNVGETATLKATVLPSDAANKNVTWSSSDKKIAAVTSDGVVKGIKAGTAIITVTTVSGKTAQCTVTVKEVQAASIKLNKSSVKINVGESVTLKAAVSPSNTTNSKVTWSSSNKKIAAVSASGVVKGIKAGTVTITAKTNNGKTAVCTVTVLPKK